MNLSLGRATLLVLLTTYILTTIAAHGLDNVTTNIPDSEEIKITNKVLFTIARPNPKSGEARPADEAKPEEAEIPDLGNGTTIPSTKLPENVSFTQPANESTSFDTTDVPVDEVMPCPGIIQMPSNSRNLQSNRTWLVSCGNYYDIIMDVKLAENLTECGRFLLVGAGHQVVESGPALLMGNGDTARSLYIPTNRAYVHWEWDNTFSSTPAFLLSCHCHRVVEEPISRIPMTTPLTPPDSESLGICLKNVDLTVARDFLNVGPLATQFLHVLENQTVNVCPKAKSVSAHIVGTSYVHLECQFSDRNLPEYRRLCVCFNVSILLQGDSKCAELTAPNALPQKILKRILENSDLVVVVNANHTFQVQLLDSHFPLSLVIGPIVLCGLSTLIFFWVWWMRDKWDEKPKKIENEQTMPVHMTPGVVKNPVFEEGGATVYMDDSIIYDPYFDDAAPLSTVAEEDEETTNGVDNPAFSLEEDDVPPSPPPLSPSTSRTILNSSPSTSRTILKNERVFPALQMKDLLPDVTSPVINDFARAPRYNQDTMFSQKKDSITSLKSSPKTTPSTPKRVAFQTSSPTFSRKSSKGDDPEKHIYEEVYADASEKKNDHETHEDRTEEDETDDEGDTAL